jgi:hypothetical protein
MSWDQGVGISHSTRPHPVSAMGGCQASPPNPPHAPRPTPQERHNVSDDTSDSQFGENKERKMITTPQLYKKRPLASGEAKRFLPKIANLVANRESNPHSANALRYGPERGHSAISSVAKRNH